MARWHFGATQLDRRVAKAVVRHASPAVERPARLLTWAADEHLLYVVAEACGWRREWATSKSADNRSSGVERRRDRHPAASAEAADRPGTAGPIHGPWASSWHSPFGQALRCLSVRPCHACGAVASAVSWAHPKWAPIAWGLGGLIAATRIVLLAHWTTDVLAAWRWVPWWNGVCGRYPDGRVSRSASKPDASGWGQLASVSRRPTPENGMTRDTASPAFGLAQGKRAIRARLESEKFQVPSSASYWPAADRERGGTGFIEPRCSNGKVLPDGKAKETQGAG